MSQYKQIITNKKYDGFVPYAYHYSNDSILTKNGELIITIKISSCEDNINLNTQIQNFLNQNSITDISTWITTIRSKNVNLSPSSLSQNNFISHSQKLYESYNKFLNIENFNNECYVSLAIHDHTNLLDVKNIFQIISSFGKNFYKENLEKVYKKLKKFCEILMKDLSGFNPKILSIKSHDDQFYSEIELFLSKIVCNNRKFSKLHKNDISSSITKNQKIKFMDSDVAIKNAMDDKEKFCSVFSLKELPKITNQKLIDDLLSTDFEIISTEILVPQKKTNKKYVEKTKEFKKFKQFLNISEDKLLHEYANSTEKNKNTLFKQNIIMIISDEENINLHSYKLNKKFSENGVILYRENIATEEVFWSQLPGNFHYTTRLQPTSIERICNLNNVTHKENSFDKKLVFNDYFQYKKIFIVKEKNFFLISGNEEKISNMMDLLINLSLAFNVCIIHFEEKRKFSNDKLKKSILHIDNMQSELREKIKKIFHEIFSILENLFNAQVDKNSLDRMVEYFFQNKIELNFKNLLSKITEEKIFNEEILQKIQILGDLDCNEEYNFFNLDYMDDEKKILIFSSYLLLYTIKKIRSKKNILLFFKNFENLSLDIKYKDLIQKIILVIKNNDLHLYSKISDDKKLLHSFIPEEEATIAIFPDETSKNVYQTLRMNADGIKFLDSLVEKKSNVICFEFDNKFHFTNFDINKFYLENKDFVLSYENA